MEEKRSAGACPEGGAYTQLTLWRGFVYNRAGFWYNGGKRKEPCRGISDPAAENSQAVRGQAPRHGAGDRTLCAGAERFDRAAMGGALGLHCRRRCVEARGACRRTGHGCAQPFGRAAVQGLDQGRVHGICAGLYGAGKASGGVPAAEETQRLLRQEVGLARLLPAD